MILFSYALLVGLFAGVCWVFHLDPLAILDPTSVAIVTIIPTVLVLTHTSFPVAFQSFLAIFRPSKSKRDDRPGILRVLKAMEFSCILTGLMGFMLGRISFVANSIDDGSVKGFILAASHLSFFWGAFLSLVVFRPARIRVQNLEE